MEFTGGTSFLHGMRHDIARFPIGLTEYILILFMFSANTCGGILEGRGVGTEVADELGHTWLEMFSDITFEWLICLFSSFLVLS